MYPLQVSLNWFTLPNNSFYLSISAEILSHSLMDQPRNKCHVKATDSTSIVMKTENALKRFF